MMKTRLFFAGLVFSLWVGGSPAPAQAEEFVKPALDSIVKTLIRFGALDIRKDEVIDIYGRVVECDIFFENYKNDFKWQKARQALRESIRRDVATFPTGYRYDTELQLARYDFKKGLYAFTDKTAQFNVNVFTMVTHKEDLCTKDSNKVLPAEYKLVLDQPVQIQGLPLSAEEGEVLLNRMNMAGNRDHIVYARFNMRVVYVAPIAERPESRGNRRITAAPMVTQNIKSNAIFLDARLDSIEYFEDPDRTKLIYIYKP